MRKHIKHFLLLLVLLALFVACGKEKPKEEKKAETTNTEEVAKKTEEAEVKADEVEKSSKNVEITTTPVVVSDSTTLTFTQIPASEALFVKSPFDLLSTVVGKDNVYVLLKDRLIAFKQDGDKLSLDESKFDKGILDVEALDLGNISLDQNTDTLYGKSSFKLYVIKEGKFEEVVVDDLKMGKFHLLDDENNAVISFPKSHLSFFTKNSDKWDLTSEKVDQDIAKFEINEMLVGNNSEILVAGKKGEQQSLVMLDKNLKTIGTYDNKIREGNSAPDVSGIKGFILNENRDLFVLANVISKGIIFKADGSHVKTFSFANLLGTQGGKVSPVNIVTLGDNTHLISGLAFYGDNIRELVFIKVEGF